jgi:hypothetical protein
MLTVYKKSGSTFTDLTVDITDYYSAGTAVNIVSATDNLYIGSRMPFNSKYFKVDVAPSPAVTVDIQYYAGNTDEFKPISSSEDRTKNLSQSGLLAFVPDRDYGIVRDDTENIDELNTLNHYGMYWYKLVFSADTDFILGWIGEIFSSDNDLGAQYPDLNRSSVKTAFKTGKTDWEEQAKDAAEEIYRDLISRKDIVDPAQLLETRELRLTSVVKTAQIIYTGLGQDFEAQAQRASDKYERLISQTPRYVDLDDNARISRFEITPKTGHIRR